MGPTCSCRQRFHWPEPECSPNCRNVLNLIFQRYVHQSDVLHDLPLDYLFGNYFDLNQENR